MNAKQDQVLMDTKKLKEIPKWTRKYAQNRTAHVLVFMTIFLILFAGIGIPSYFGGFAYRNNNMVLFGICIFFLIVAMICTFIISVPKWGNKIIEKIVHRIYADEGSIVIPAPKSTKQKKWLDYVVGIIFGCCILASVQLGLMGYLVIEDMQPISAVYTVPFLVFLYFRQRPMVGPIALLWPILYGVHAILIVAGVPILFHRPWISLNMLIPVAGYGMLCGLIGHIYSRHALKKLKGVAHIEGATANEV